MIALRGKIRHKSIPKTQNTNPNHAPPTSDGTPFNPLTSKDGEWIWTGHWAFGSLPEEDEIDAALNQSMSGVGRKPGKRKPPQGVRPFVYKFEKITEAKDVIVPSSTSGENEGYQDPQQEEEQQQQQKQHQEEEHEQHQEQQQDKDKGQGNVSEGKGERKKDGMDEEMKGVTEETREGKKDGRCEEMKGGGDKDGASIRSHGNVPISVKAEDISVNKEKVDDANVSPTEDVVDTKTSDATDATVKKEEDGDVTMMDVSKDSSKDDRGTHDKPTSTATSTATTTVETHTSEVKKEESKESSSASITSIDAKTDDADRTNSTQNSSTFAEVEGGTFTDAGRVTYPDKCPIGGCWKGFFENVSKRKDRMTSRVQESFYLFFNSTPSADSRMAFDLDDNDGEHTANSGGDAEMKSSDAGGLPPGYIHVRGSGNNHFGTFEIIGGYNVKTGSLSCQRIYVSTVDGNAKANKDKNKEKPKGSASTPLRKSYFTRKRPVSFKRPGFITDDGIKKVGSSAKKRPRVMSEHTLGKDKDASAIVGPIVSIKANNIIIPPAVPIPPVIIRIPPLKISVPVATITKPTPRRPSPNKSSQSRKPKSSPQTNGKAGQPSNAFHIAIPKVGNTQEARWKSAHYLYYLRHTDESNSPSNSSSNPVTPAKTSYVVYEGEMNGGNSTRDGKGVCLFNNNMIYEGQWRKNKEHGHGSLFNGNRSQTIYVGEWERGKMHGIGTYYYHTIGRDGKLEEGGKFCGDFKENSRHGIGKYSLTDGSTYDGEWRDNVPCGKGLFYWPDGSTYDGHWKDGKRHGMGKLDSADGFMYDGMWIYNAMEGKGSAVYPNGQQYDGNWLNGKRDGRGTIVFGNGAVYKGRFKEDCLEGQGTLKLDHNVAVSRAEPEDTGDEIEDSEAKKSENNATPASVEEKDDWMIPIEFQSDIGHIHQKAGFTAGGE